MERVEQNNTVDHTIMNKYGIEEFWRVYVLIQVIFYWIVCYVWKWYRKLYKCLVILISNNLKKNLIEHLYLTKNTLMIIYLK